MLGQNAIIQFISCFIFSREARHEFRRKYKKRTKFNKLYDELSLIKKELQNQENNIYRMASCKTQKMLCEEVSDYLNLIKCHAFFLGQRGEKLTKYQIKYITQINEKVRNGEYKLMSYKCLCGECFDEIIAVRDRYGIKMNTVICKNCGLVRINPYYDKDALKNFYNNEYDHIYRGGVHMNFNDHFSKQISHGKRIISMLKNNDITVNNKLVYEVGCAGGGILKPFQDLGCDVIGTDYDKNLILSGKNKGLNLRVGGVESLEDVPPGDIIILHHVLEHVPNPIDFLICIKSILKDDGILYVAVPTLETIKTQYKNNFFMYLQNAHVFYFSTNTLIYTLKCAGFNVNKIGIDEVIAKKSTQKEEANVNENEYIIALSTIRDAEKEFFNYF